MPSPDASIAILDRLGLEEDRLDTLNPQALRVLDGLWMDRTDPTNPQPRKGGHLTRIKSAVLHNLVTAFQPSRTIEIGLLLGASAMVIMAAAQREGYLGHFAMDPAQNTHAKGAGLENIVEAGLKPLFTFLEIESCYGLPYLIINASPTFDFAFIDASHHFDHTLLEFFYLDRMVPVGGVIAFDDIKTPAVEAVINYVAANRHYVCRRVGGLVCAIKMADDLRHWFEFNRFEIPDGAAFMQKKYTDSGKTPRLKSYKS